MVRMTLLMPAEAGRPARCSSATDVFRPAHVLVDPMPYVRFCTAPEKSQYVVE